MVSQEREGARDGHFQRRDQYWRGGGLPGGRLVVQPLGMAGSVYRHRQPGLCMRHPVAAALPTSPKAPVADSRRARTNPRRARAGIGIEDLLAENSRPSAVLG